MNTVRLRTWEEFRKFVKSGKAINGYYWRGQQNSEWPLASAFEREILKIGVGKGKKASQIYPYGGRYKRDDGTRIWGDGYYQSIRDNYLHHFKKAASGLRGPNPEELTTEEWWALGRHYGLVTPLLDWSLKPYIAAFFAMADLFDQKLKQSVQVYGNETVAIFRLQGSKDLEDEEFRVINPTIDELGRMQNQSSVFTWLNSEDVFELEGYLDLKGKGDLLTKVILSDKAIQEGLYDLDAYGINYRYLFPDLEGAAKYANSTNDIALAGLISLS